MTRLCKARAKSGARCQAHAGPSGWCWAHDPALRRKRAEARRKGGRGRAYKPGEEGERADLGTVEEIRAGLSRALAATWIQDNTPRRTRALVSVYALALRAIEVEGLERLDALERRIEEVEHATQ